MKEGTAPLRCAVYTRKSSEEGLDQSFNSLHAQREACEAYILSQRHEGWRLVPGKYDDGGFSGGNMDRPGLKRLLHDIDNGKVDIVVVYKVDRLTRSLSDFAKMVEVFDSKKASFVSVTQQFNTTSSMGRLTLNVLLSFAQFEREVTGERIRDKFAASKRKGMWMGGTLPFGYDLGDRCLVVNETEAIQIRHIFEMYLKFESVFDLYEYLKVNGYRSKPRTFSTGRKTGGMVLSRGVLYHLLNNPLYIGKVRHKGQLHEGQHEAIVTQEVWDGVANLLSKNRASRKINKNVASEHLLTGILRTEAGVDYTPTYSSKKGRRFHYYVARADGLDTHRLPAREIDRTVADSLREMLLNSLDLAAQFSSLSVSELRLLTSAAKHRSEQLLHLESAEMRSFLQKTLEAVIVQKDRLLIRCDKTALAISLLGASPSSPCEEERIDLVQRFLVRRRGGGVRLVLQNAPNREGQPVSSLVRMVAQSREWSDRILSGEIVSMNQLARSAGVSWLYASRMLRCAALAPQHVQTILEGRQPSDLTVEKLTKELPLLWRAQSLDPSEPTQSPEASSSNFR